jgi:hypothetical protein
MFDIICLGKSKKNDLSYKNKDEIFYKFTNMAELLLGIYVFVDILRLVMFCTEIYLLCFYNIYIETYFT